MHLRNDFPQCITYFIDIVLSGNVVNTMSCGYFHCAKQLVLTASEQQVKFPADTSNDICILEQ